MDNQEAKQLNQPDRKWEGKTGGGKFGQNFLLWFLGGVGVRVLYPILYLVIPFYLIFAKKGRDAAYRYFRDRQGYAPMRAAWATFQNHILFGKVVLDKFALLAGNRRQFKVIPSDETPIRQRISEPGGFIIAGAHVGNLELAGLCIPHSEKRINAIVFGGEQAGFQSRRDDAFKQSDIRLIPVGNDLSHLFTIKEALENGEIVVIPCDRMFGSNKGVDCPFLEGEAKFPLGTFRLAAQLNVPVYTLFIMKEKGMRYRTFENRINSAEGDARKQASEMACEYVRQLNEIVRRYPTQWFNFFPFWNEK